MLGAQVEYVGFTVRATAREYTLRARQAPGEFRDFTLAIAHEAFLAGRVRYQDAAEICFLKLRRELTSCGEGLPAARLKVSDAELEDYRLAHAPRTPIRRKPRPPIPSESRA